MGSLQETVTLYEKRRILNVLLGDNVVLEESGTTLLRLCICTSFQIIVYLPKLALNIEI